MNTRQKGAWGEDQAALFLERQGYTLIDRNVQTRFGEVDIIAANSDDALCFVEVKLRQWRRGSAEKASDQKKIQKLFAVAQVYCQEHDIDVDTTQICFEHISVYPTKRDRSVHFQKWPLSLDNAEVL